MNKNNIELMLIAHTRRASSTIIAQCEYAHIHRREKKNKQFPRRSVMIATTQLKYEQQYRSEERKLQSKMLLSI